MVGAGGFEPPKLKAADLQSVPIGHSGTRPYSFVCPLPDDLFILAWKSSGFVNLFFHFFFFSRLTVPCPPRFIRLNCVLFYVKKGKFYTFYRQEWVIAWSQQSAPPRKFLSTGKTLRSHRCYWVLRRAQDIVFSLLALIPLSPLTADHLAIVWTAPVRAIFSQRRVGRNGKLFWLYKFRTMCPDAEEQLNDLPQTTRWTALCSR